MRQLALGRSIERLRAEVRGEDPRQTVTTFGAPPATRPRVSVVLTVYNYASVVAEAIGSVAASDFTDYELVVVDDASSDDSALVIQTTLERMSWVDATLVRCPMNVGLPAARNTGIERARGEFVFILDADNALYPHALGRLTDALDARPSATFAYGICEQFTPQGSSGLLSYLDWDPERLRGGNYIDAMSLIRRSAIEEVGGYTTNPKLFGWEDFALWCTFAERGWWGVHVREILARYRTAPGSMIATTNIDVAIAWQALVERFPTIIGGLDADVTARASAPS
jgi:glycosyltransferase involved in cell wall biosynthesis